jgi:hypothetical protein
MLFKLYQPSKQSTVEESKDEEEEKYNDKSLMFAYLDRVKYITDPSTGKSKQCITFRNQAGVDCRRY